jgi:nicotinamide-nucleotide amidase
MRAAILAIGDEIVAGLTADTNSAFVADRLRTVGVEPVGFFAASDDEDAIVLAFRRALEDADIAISTGGLGPTADDLTTAAVARLARRPLRLDEVSLRAMEERFRSIGRPMSANNRKQALLPEGSEVIANPTGTAPGFICRIEIDGRPRHTASLPGVPGEMRRMVDESLLPWLAARAPRVRFASRVLSTFGLPESQLDEALTGLVDPAEARLAFRAAFPRIQARITVSGAPDEDLESRLDRLERDARARLGSNLYAVGDVGMEEVVGRLLTERRLTLGVAESCTGGLIGHRLTDVPGSSAYLRLGVVAYANEAKRALLGVREETLARHGAVSTEVAEQMAEGVRLLAGAEIGLATTGIAGPDGGTADKPVGTVCIGLAWSDGVWSRRYQLGARDREWVKGMTAQVALDRLRRWLIREEDPAPA